MPGTESKFNKKVLDFDYSDDEDGGGDIEPTPQMLDAIATLLTNERLLKKLQVLYSYFMKNYRFLHSKRHPCQFV